MGKAKPKSSHEFVVYAGYHQFYLFGVDGPDANTGGDFWGRESQEARLGVAAGVVGIFAASDSDVRVVVDVYARRPPTDLDSWDHVAEASLTIRNGRLSVYGCPDPEPVGEIELPSGDYRLRVHHGNLDNTEEAHGYLAERNAAGEEVGDIYPPDDQGDDEVSPDHYRIAVWPEDAAPVQILKRWQFLPTPTTDLSPDVQGPQEMTESRWLAANEISEELLNFVSDRAGTRKVRLFACACTRRIWPRLEDERSRQAVETAEQFADGLADAQRLAAACTAAEKAEKAQDRAARQRKIPKGMYLDPVSAAAYCARLCALEDGTQQLNLHPLCSAIWRSTPTGPELTAEDAALLHLLRDMISNPFRPVKIDPAWLKWNKGVVRKLAQAIYDERAFERLPVLADALEEAGCRDAGILGHCREPGEHARGCWVIDLLLGKN
jgi:hypothetical protein